MCSKNVIRINSYDICRDYLDPILKGTVMQII